MIRVGRMKEVFYENGKSIKLDYDEKIGMTYLTVEEKMIQLNSIERQVLIAALQEHTPDVESITNITWSD